jgi:hypothetical protein
MRVVEEHASGSRTSSVLLSQNSEKRLCGQIPREANGRPSRPVRKAKGTNDGQVIGFGMDSGLTVKSAVRVMV